MLKGKKIVLGISGSIAAYKSVHLLRLLLKEGAEVKVIMTPAAKDFVSPLVLSTLSKHEVLIDLFDEKSWANHVMLGRWADILLIAPLSSNTLAKMANGLCDNLLLTVYLSAICPVIVAPAMDEDMWLHPATKNNLATLSGYGNNIIQVAKGELASGLIGEGRMAEPEEIVNYVAQFFSNKGAKELIGKKALVTAGPTYEAIDPVRFISNHSSGKMGIALAKELQQRGADVTLVVGPVNVALLPEGVKSIKVISADDMYEACQKEFSDTDIAIMAAAVADYTPVEKAKEKIKKKTTELSLELVKTKDILKSLGERKKNNQIVIGFALETTNEEKHAIEKMSSKNADMIVLNSLNDAGAGFGHDTNKVTVFKNDGVSVALPIQSKEETARSIIDIIIQSYYA